MVRTLKFKIAAAAFLIISLILAFSTWRNITVTEQRLLDGQKEKAVLLSERIMHGIMVLMLKNRWPDLQTMMEGIVRDSRDLKELRIFQAGTGIIVASSHPAEVGQKIYDEDLRMLKRADQGEAFLIRKGGEMYASKLTLIDNQPSCHGCHGTEKKALGVLDLEVSLVSVYKSIGQFKKEHLLDALMGFAMMSGGILLAVWFLIDRPVQKMIGTIRKIEGGDLTARMDEGSMDELGVMARSFNSMVSSLEEARRSVDAFHEEQIQHASKMASLGEIVSGIAHEIKNPLAGISCAVQVIQSELSDEDERKSITKEILNQTKRLDKTVKSLLNYARPKPPRFSLTDLGEELDKALFFVNSEAKKHNVTVEMEVEKDLPGMHMDGDQMQQVFLNLMINSVQAMPSGGKLTVTVSELPATEAGEIAEGMGRAESIVAIRFKDTGTGIAPEYRASIFDPFFTKKSKGTGLGLSISQRIVHEHGGEITVQSETGKGTVFTVYLPAAQKKEAAMTVQYEQVSAER